jgi:hypothetical protein
MKWSSSERRRRPRRRQTTGGGAGGRLRLESRLPFTPVHRARPRVAGECTLPGVCCPRRLRRGIPALPMGDPVDRDDAPMLSSNRISVYRCPATRQPSDQRTDLPAGSGELRSDHLEVLEPKWKVHHPAL